MNPGAESVREKLEDAWAQEQAFPEIGEVRHADVPVFMLQGGEFLGERRGWVNRAVKAKALKRLLLFCDLEAVRKLLESAPNASDGFFTCLGIFV